LYAAVAGEPAIAVGQPASQTCRPSSALIGTARHSEPSLWSRAEAVAQPACASLKGDGAEEQPLPDMRRTDARSRQIGRRDGVRCRLQRIRQSVEPRPASRT